ncbi:MAG: hypothetical protein WBW78_15810 [Terrimicrobiaceae bacterium]
MAATSDGQNHFGGRIARGGQRVGAGAAHHSLVKISAARTPKFATAAQKEY